MLLEWNDEHDAAIRILQDVGVWLVVHAPHDDVTALDVSHAHVDARVAQCGKHLMHPRAGRVDECARRDIPRRAIRPGERRAPRALVANSGAERGPYADLGAAR